MNQAKDRSRLRKVPGRLLLWPLLALLTSCAAAGEGTVRLQWPPAPSVPQVAFVRSISDYKDAGVRTGWWHRMADAVVGETGERIGRPYGVYLDERERLLVVDTAFSVVHVIDPEADSYSTIGAAGESRAFKTPIAVTGDDAGNLYITDSSAGLVYRYSFRDKSLKPFIQTLQRPTGIAFSRRKRLLYVADTLGDKVAVFDLNGNQRFTIGSTGAGPGRLNHPTDIFVDAAGTLYVTDPLNYRVQLFSADGMFVREFGSPGDGEGEFLKPKGIAVDSAGSIYVADALSDAVKVFDASGRYRFSFGSNGSADGMFWLPSGLYIDGKDRIYVSDTYNRRVQLFRRVGAEAKEKEK